MKNRLKLAIPCMVFVAFVLGFYKAEAQNPVAKIDFSGTNLVAGSTITVPLLLTGDNVGSYQFLIAYDRDVLSYVSHSTTVSGYGLTGVSNTFTHASLPGQTFLKASLAYTAGGSGQTYSNQAIFTFTFTYNGGYTNLSFENKAILVGNLGTQFTFVKANPYTTINLLTNFVNGSASGDYLTLHSISAGGDWSTASTWQENKTPSRIYDVFITNNLVTDNSATGRCNNLTIDETGKLTVAVGKTLSVKGDFLIKSNSSSTGSFVDLGTTIVSGSTTVNRYMDGNWVVNQTEYQSHLISSPVADQSNDIFTGSLMNKWNEVAYRWDPMTLPFETMAVGKGYAVSPASPGLTAIFSGVLNTGDVTVSGLTKTGSGINDGFNLVGNPFASSIDWIGSITRTNVNPTAWVWNNAGAYISYALGGGSIAGEQGFFVLATGAGSMMIPSSVRSHGGDFYKADKSNWLTLKVEGNNYWDQTQVSINPQSTIGYEGEYDALKLMGSPAAPQLFCLIPDTKLSINTLPSLDESSKIELGFRPGAEGSFTITAQDLETFTASNEMYLVDLLTNTTQNLKTNPVYTFNAAPGQLEHRFDLKFSTVGIDEVGASKLNIYAVGKVVNIEIPGGVKGEIIVYNLLGSEIARKAVEANSLNKINLNVPSGYYLVRVNGVSYTANGKVFIK